MDTSKVGTAVARAMDEIDRLVSAGEIPEDAHVGAVALVVAIDQETPLELRDRLRATATQCFVFCEPDQLYIQLGLIELARENYAPDLLQEDD